MRIKAASDTPLAVAKECTMMSLWQRRACTRPYPSLPVKLCLCPQINRTSPGRPTVPSQSADPNTYDLLGPRSPGIARHNLALTGPCPKLSKIIWTQILSLLPFRLYLFRLLLPDFEVSENASLCRTTNLSIACFLNSSNNSFRKLCNFESNFVRPCGAYVESGHGEGVLASAEARSSWTGWTWAKMAKMATERTCGKFMMFMLRDLRVYTGSWTQICRTLCCNWVLRNLVDKDDTAFCMPQNFHLSQAVWWSNRMSWSLAEAFWLAKFWLSTASSISFHLAIEKLDLPAPFETLR